MPERDVTLGVIIQEFKPEEYPINAPVSQEYTVAVAKTAVAGEVVDVEIVVTNGMFAVSACLFNDTPCELVSSGIPELAAERIAELRRMAAELRQPRNYVERLEFSVSTERGSVKTVPTDYAKGFLPASAPEAKAVRAAVGFSDAVRRADGSGSELRFRKTAAAEVTLK